MKRTAVLNIVGLTKSLIGPQMPNIGRFVERSCLKHIRPTFPAVTCTAQSTYLTGVNPSQHGIVGNGWYDREYAEHRFWKQSNHLVQSPSVDHNFRLIESQNLDRYIFLQCLVL